MKYEIEMRVALPRARMIELFENQENFPKWQPDPLEMKTVSGTPGKKGAVTEYVYRIGKRPVEMTETIVSSNLPYECSATYVNKSCWNIVENRFEEVSPTETRWHVKTEFKATGFMRIMLALMPGAFRKETRKHMEAFKSFAESQDS